MNLTGRNKCYGRLSSDTSSCKWTVVAIGTLQLINICMRGSNVDALICPSHSPWSETLRVSQRTESYHQVTTLYSTISPNKPTGSISAQTGRIQRSRINRVSSNAPWAADYITSRRTQDIIVQSAAAASENSDPFQCAQIILQTLLNTPATKCNPANIVCALTLSAKTLGEKKCAGVQVSLEYRQTLTEIINVLQTLVDDNKPSPRQLCNAAWAIAKHVEHDKSLPIEEIFDSIALRMIEHLKTMRSQSEQRKHVQTGELTMLLWAIASAKPRKSPPGWERPPQFEKISLDNQRILKRKSKNKNREDHLVTFVSDDDQSDEMDAEDDRVNGNNSSWSATARLFDAAAIALCRGEGAAAIQSPKNDMSMLKSCTWKELSNIAWSFAARGAYGTKESDAMMSFLAREATRRITLAMRAPPTLTGGTRNKYCKLLPRDVIQIAWALGIMDSDKASNGNALVHLVDAINEYWVDNKSNESYRHLSYLRGADLVQLCVALAHGRLDNVSVLKAIYEEATGRLRKSPQRFSAAELSILLWAQARLNLSESQGSVFGEFPSFACRAILNQIAIDEADDALHKIGLRSQEQANLAWSLTVLNQFDEHVTLLLQHVFQASASQPDGSIQLEHAHQLWQAYFILCEDLPDAVKFVPPKFSKYLERKWNNEKDRTKKSSSRHKAISKTLELLGIAHENEYQEDVDVAIALSDTTSFTSQAQMPMSALGGDNEHKIAVEFDGPYHFTVMASTGDELAQVENGVKIQPRVLGHTALKYKMLKKKGWTVIRIPYYEWDKIPHWASMERQRYLQRCLKTHQEIQFSEVDVSQYQALPQTRHSRFD
ncbi:hypothetical protein ACHAWO_005018 [Cyclotella atomus]|uniref:RAP domain-containing protein n=1 Tax=Cyclotella atomus TaxID=382360 RepID=A0ABD3PTK2_9STRA